MLCKFYDCHAVPSDSRLHNFQNAIVYFSLDSKHFRAGNAWTVRGNVLNQYYPKNFNYQGENRQLRFGNYEI